MYYRFFSNYSQTTSPLFLLIFGPSSDRTGLGLTLWSSVMSGPDFKNTVLHRNLPSTEYICTCIYMDIQGVKKHWPFQTAISDLNNACKHLIFWKRMLCTGKFCYFKKVNFSQNCLFWAKIRKNSKFHIGNFFK